MYLLDIWRKQAPADIWVDAFCDLCQKYRPLEWAEEPGQIKSGVGPFLEKRMRYRRIYVNRRSFSARGDKAVRARSIQGRMALDGLYYPKNANWVSDFLAEILQFPAGKHDDQCVAEGTLIRMANGNDQLIERISAGDLVATPLGSKSVLAICQTNPAASVYRVMFSNGQSLTATGNHPIYVEGRGFVLVDQLHMRDQCREVPPTPKSSSTEVTDTAAIRTVQAGRIGNISAPQSRDVDFCTGISGKTNAGRFLMDAKSTTLMKIHQTMRLAISNAFRHSPIGVGIRWLVKALLDSASTLIAFGSRQPNGILLLQATSGTANMANDLGGNESRNSSNVSAATHHSKPILTVPSIAHANAPNVIAIEALTQPMAVYNLMVADAHVYYANGVLTHNCDALGLVGQLLDVMIVGKLKKAAIPQLPEDGYQPRKIKTPDPMLL
jgi:predicted phage terminase large subunit-like protein